MNLLERTRRLLQVLAPPGPAKVQYYSVACPDGHRLRGERTEGYQALRCPTCGEGMFVLPRSPLPEPVAPSAPRTAKTAGEFEPAARTPAPDRPEEPVALSDPIGAMPAVEGEFEVDGEIEWVEAEPETTDAPVAAVAPEDRPAREKAAPRRPSRGPSPAPSGRQVAVAGARRESLVRWARARRNPLIFAAVGLIVVGTIGFRTWRSRFQDLPRIAERGRIEGLAALDAGDFDAAHQLLSEAKRAVDSLGGAVEGAEEIRHGAEEAALFASRGRSGLETILEEASSDPHDPAWSSKFKTFYKGQAVIVTDAEITSVPGSDDSETYELDYEILPNGEGSDPKSVRRGTIDLAGFRLFEQARPKKGALVRFGARLAAVRLDADTKLWRFTLEPDSGVFLTHPDAIEALGASSSGDDPEADGDPAP